MEIFLHLRQRLETKSVSYLITALMYIVTSLYVVSHNR